jgi:hypothetical protein
MSFNDGRYRAKNNEYLKKFQSRMEILLSPSLALIRKSRINNPGIKVSKMMKKKKRITRNPENKKI